MGLICMFFVHTRKEVGSTGQFQLHIHSVASEDLRGSRTKWFLYLLSSSFFDEIFIASSLLPLALQALSRPIDGEL